MPAEAEFHVELLDGFVHIDAVGPAVAAVVERPIAAGLVDHLDARLVVAIHVGHVQRFGESEMRIVGLGGIEARGAGEKRRPLGKRGAIGLGVFAARITSSPTGSSAMFQ